MNTAIQINIKRQLAEKNMTAAELERRTGIPHAVVNILHGRSKNPSLRTAQAIAKELGCSVEELFHEQPQNQTKCTDNALLYKKAFEAVLAEVTQQQLAIVPASIGKCIAEVYEYTLGSPSQNVDPRFVAWTITKSMSAI